MGIYENRLKPAYRNSVDLAHCKNQEILKWWQLSYDDLIEGAIREWAWAWPWCITDILVDTIPKQILDHWKAEDPLCKQFAWYNILMHFATARAVSKGLVENIRAPEQKCCLLCAHEFVEDSLPHPFIRRLGIERLNYCAPCLSAIVLQDTGDTSSSEAEIAEYLASLSKIIGRVPHQGFGEGINDLVGLDQDVLHKVLLLMQAKPSTSRVILT